MKIKKVPVKVLIPLCIFGSWLAATIVIIMYTMNSLQLKFDDINWSRISDRATLNIVKLFGFSDDEKKSNISTQIYKNSLQLSANEDNKETDDVSDQEKIPYIVNTKDKSAANKEQQNQTFSADKFTREDFAKSLELGITPAAGQTQKVW